MILLFPMTSVSSFIHL